MSAHEGQKVEGAEKLVRLRRFAQFEDASASLDELVKKGFPQRSAMILADGISKNLGQAWYKGLLRVGKLMSLGSFVSLSLATVWLFMRNSIALMPTTELMWKAAVFGAAVSLLFLGFLSWLKRRSLQSRVPPSPAFSAQGFDLVVAEEHADDARELLRLGSQPAETELAEQQNAELAD